MTEAQKRAIKKYQQKNYIRKSVLINKKNFEPLERYLKNKNLTFNKFINNYIKKHNKTI